MIDAGEKIEPTWPPCYWSQPDRGQTWRTVRLAMDGPGRGAGTLTIARSVYETHSEPSWAEKSTKSRQIRRIGLDDITLATLRRVRQARDDLAASLGLEVQSAGFIFSRSPIGAEPIGPDTVTRFAKRAAGEAKVDTHLHALRHFSASQAIGAALTP